MADHGEIDVARVTQTPDELEQHLRDQLGFLRASARGFDEGDAAEAKRLATTLRILLHHRPQTQSHSLLVQLGVRDSWQWLDTAGGMDQGNLLPSSNLTVMLIDVSSETPTAFYAAPLGGFYPGPKWSEEMAAVVLAETGEQPPRPAGGAVPFDAWWSEPVIQDDQGAFFSRFDLVAAVANQDGGGHVDPTLNDAYHRLSRSNSLGSVVNDGRGGMRPLGNPVPAAVRQIAYEVDVTIHAEWPALAASRAFPL